MSFIMYPLAAATAAEQQNDRYDATDIAVVATSIAHFYVVVGCCASIAIAAATEQKQYYK